MRIHAIFGGIGAFAVKFRWVVIAAWLIAAFAVPHYLPSLSSVTQGNNSAFLPASAPSEQAAQLAAPFGSTNLIPVPIVAAVSQGTLTPGDVAWLSTLQHDLSKVPTVVAVHDLGRSADGQAEQLQVLSNTGTTVTSAGLVLAGTFSVFALVGGRGSGGSQIRDVGVGLALGVLMDTFIVRTILVPCTVVLLGRWNWWPSALSRTGPEPGGELGNKPVGADQPVIDPGPRAPAREP